MPSQTLELTAPPARLKGRELETHCVKAMERAERESRATMSRYGVQCSRIDGEVVPMRSLPDFEGLLTGGTWFSFDAKVCSQSKFDLDSSKTLHERQLPHLFKRSRFGGITFLLLHWNERVLKTKAEDAVTWAFPCDPEMDFWQRVSRHETKAIRRDDCEDYGVMVGWTVPPRGRIARPDIVSAIEQLIRRNP